MELAALVQGLPSPPVARAEGRVLGARGLAVTLSLPGARIGDAVRLHRRGPPLLAEIRAFQGGECVALPLGDLAGLGPGDRAEGLGGPLPFPVGTGLVGRVVDPLGRALDGGGPPAGEPVAVDGTPPPPLERLPVTRPLVTGLRAIDGLVTLGEGQRVGLLAGSGVGKSTLLAALAEGTEADRVVVALVGERGREVRELLDGGLAAARERATVVVATSDASPLERLRAATAATRLAEHFRDEGSRVLLLVDSMTRVARAQREIGLATGEAPARRGYPPSTFALLPRLVERAGQGARGSITAVYTVLVEGDDLDEPVTDELRGLLDGHLVLSRALAARQVHPAIDVTRSVSRVFAAVASAEHRALAARARAALALLDEKRDLLDLGAHRPGQDPDLDRALRLRPALEAFLQQEPSSPSPLAGTLRALERALAG